MTQLCTVTQSSLLHELSLFLKLLIRSPVNLGEDLRELDSNVGGVAVEHLSIAITNLTRMVHDDNQRSEARSLHRRIFLGVWGDITTLDNIITREGLLKSFMVQLDRLNFSCQPRGTEGDNHSRLEDSSFYAAYWECTNTTNLVHVLKGESGSIHLKNNNRNKSTTELWRRIYKRSQTWCINNTISGNKHRIKPKTFKVASNIHRIFGYIKKAKE